MRPLFGGAVPSRLRRVVVVSCIVGALTAIVSYRGLEAAVGSGRLSVPPTYDDVVYFDDAARWLSHLPLRTAASSTKALLFEHAPLATISAIAGFLLTPDSYFGHYAINALTIAAFLIGMVGLTWKSRMTDIVSGLFLVASCPLLIQVLNEARPDLGWGLCLGLTVGAIAKDPLVNRSTRSTVWLGLLSGFAVLLKPSAFPASLALIFIVLTGSVVADRVERGNEPRSLVRRPLLLFVLVLACVITPYLLANFETITSYIRQVLVLDRDLWAYNASFRERITFYSTGHAGRIALGGWFTVGAALLLARLVLGGFINRRDLTRALVLNLGVVASYSIPTIPLVKSFFLGAIFYGTFLVAMALNLIEVLRLCSGALHTGIGPAVSLKARVAILTVLATLFLKALFLNRVELATDFSENSRLDMREASGALWSLVQDRARALGSSPTHPLEVVFTSPYPVSPALLQLYADRTDRPILARQAYRPRTVEQAVRALSGAQLAVVTSSQETGPPGARMGDEIIRALDREPEMCPVASWRLRATRVLRIYERQKGSCPPSGPSILSHAP